MQHLFRGFPGLLAVLDGRVVVLLKHDRNQQIQPHDLRLLAIGPPSQVVFLLLGVPSHETLDVLGHHIVDPIPSLCVKQQEALGDHHLLQ